MQFKSIETFGETGQKDLTFAEDIDSNSLLKHFLSKKSPDKNDAFKI